MLPPVFEQGNTPCVSGSMLLYFINPFSANKDIAVQFLEYAAKSADPAFMYLLSPKYNEPLFIQEWVDVVDYLQKELDEIHEAKLTALGDDVFVLSDAAEALEKQLQNAQRLQYRLSEAEIMRYRELAPYISFSRYSFIHNLNHLVLDTDSDLLARLNEGQIDVYYFLDDMNNRMNRIYLENQ